MIAGLMRGIKVNAVTTEELEKEVQTLKLKVQELEKYTFPPEKVDEIKKVSEYVCPNGHTFSSVQKDMICPEDGLKVKERSALVKVKLNRREEIGEKISGMLDEELKKRVNLAVSGTGIVQHIADSLQSSTKRQTFAEGFMDIFLLSRPMKNSIFFINVEAEGGQGPDSTIANSSVLNSNITHLPSTTQTDQVRLREAWVQKTGYNQQLQFIIGKIDVTNYFDRNRAANDETSQFITGTLVNNPVLGNPANGPGMTLLYDSRRGVAAGAAIQSANAMGVNVSEEPYAIGEVDFKFRFLFGQLGNCRFWAARNGRTVGDQRDDYSAGISMDQEVGPNVIAFGRIGRSIKKDPVRDPHAWSAGLMLHDFLPVRRRDKIGIGYSHFLTPASSSLSGETENVGEFYYSIFMTEHFFVSPIAQYVFHSAGSAIGAPQSNILILGLRTQIYF